MPFLNVSNVTKALINLVKAHVESSPEWPALTTVTVSPLPPDKLAGEHTIGLYLFHIVEDPTYKNQPPVGEGPVPLRFTPMGLHLYYQVTARSDLIAENGPFEEQFLMGLAIKALRDNPVLKDDTTVAGVTVFPAALQGRQNKIRIELQPLPPNEAMQYWTAGNQPMRLAAYYQVSATLLEPEPVTSRSGRVLKYGVHTFVRGAPRLDSSRSSTTFTIPGEATPRTVDVQPAEVTYGQTVTFLGTELVDDGTSLLIKSAEWLAPIEADPVQWGVTATDTRVMATVPEAAALTPDIPGTREIETILPGIYSAAARVRTTRTMPDGSLRNFDSLSNETPFAIAPRVDTVNLGVTPHEVVALGLGNPPLPGDNIQLYLGPDRLTRVAGVPAPGQFRTTGRNAAGTRDLLEFRFPAGIAAGTTVSFRLVVRGIESAPRWIIAP